MVENEAVEMWGFKRTPPPPPPKSRAWIVQLITPIVFAIIVGLAGLVFTGLKENVGALASDLKDKVDNKTLQLMIEKQDMIIQHQREEADRQRQEDSKKFEQIQRTQSKTLDRIEAIQAPKGLMMKSAAPPPKIVRENPSGDILTPDEFEKYIMMDPRVREKYKQYLQSKGKDVSGLPD